MRQNFKDFVKEQVDIESGRVLSNEDSSNVLKIYEFAKEIPIDEFNKMRFKPCVTYIFMDGLVPNLEGNFEPWEVFYKRFSDNENVSIGTSQFGIEITFFVSKLIEPRIFRVNVTETFIRDNVAGSYDLFVKLLKDNS